MSKRKKNLTQIDLENLFLDSDSEDDVSLSDDIESDPSGGGDGPLVDNISDSNSDDDDEDYCQSDNTVHDSSSSESSDSVEDDLLAPGPSSVIPLQNVIPFSSPDPVLGNSLAPVTTNNVPGRTTKQVVPKRTAAAPKKRAKKAKTDEWDWSELPDPNCSNTETATRFRTEMSIKPLLDS